MCVKLSVCSIVAFRNSPHPGNVPCKIRVRLLCILFEVDEQPDVILIRRPRQHSRAFQSHCFSLRRDTSDWNLSDIEPCSPYVRVNPKSVSKLLCDWRSVSQSVCLCVEPTLGLVTRYYLLAEGFCLKFAVLSLWGALSDERTGLQFAAQSLNGPSRAEPVTILHCLN
jgi:hypothetical protein